MNPRPLGYVPTKLSLVGHFFRKWKTNSKFVKKKKSKKSEIRISDEKIVPKLKIFRSKSMEFENSQFFSHLTYKMHINITSIIFEKRRRNYFEN